jgi:PAS domain S-box-containing protein
VRYNRRYHFDILVTIGAPVLLFVLSRANALTTVVRPGILFTVALLLLVQPFTLLQLVDHFRSVPRLLKWAAIVGTTGGTLLLLILPAPRPPWFLTGAAGYMFAVQGYAAWAFVVQARRTAGITRLRLKIAAVGAFVGVAAMSLEGVARIMGTRSTGAAQVLFLLGFVGCYYFGLATPHRVLRSWQRTELYRFLKGSNERAWGDREELVSADLNRAVERGVQAASTAVFLGPDALSIKAANGPDWRGVTIEPGDGLVGKALGGGEPALGRREQCEPAVRDRAAGDFVAVIPIITSSHQWGVVIVVQRRKSLFLREDLDLLKALCRHTADILDHARLLHEERRRAQRKADARVRESESRLAIMVDSLSDYMIVELDDDGRITSWNRGAAEMFGYAADAIVGQPATRLLGDGITTFPADLESARHGRSALREGPFRREDGKTFTGNSLVRRLQYDGQDFGGFVMVTRDVTEQRRLEDRVSQGQKMEAIGRLAAGVAHDFNNLLTVILGFAALNESDLPADHGLRDDVVEIRKAAERAAALVRQLLAFSRRQVVEPRPVQVSHVLTELLPMLRRLLGDRVEIVDHLAVGNRPVLADPHQLEQIVVNLAVNARDAMRDGGRLTLRVSTVTIDGSWSGSYPEPKPGPYAMIEVTDTGSGMDSATLAHIFEPFFTTKEVGQGTGLGLATVYGLVQQMGGGINAYSELGIGTTFKIYLPEANVAEAAVKPARRTSAPRGTETVLLAEDESQIRRFVASVLKRAGYTVLASANPAEALEMASAHSGRLDLLVTDMVMPGGTGPELAERLRALHPELPVLFVSGNADLGLAARSGVTLDEFSFLQKPFTADQLLTHIRQSLDNSRLAGAAAPGEAR